LSSTHILIKKRKSLYYLKI